MVSASGHAAHPDEIVESCRKLQAHLQRQQEEADRAVKEWEERIRQRDLAEKRRVAPGWLDAEQKLLEPERPNEPKNPPGRASVNVAAQESASAPDPQDRVGEELDRAFGGLDVR